jgi:hypothetical protein
MRSMTLIFAIAGGSLLLAAAPASAHHSFTAEFDSTKSLKLTGKVTKVEWTNPHAYIYLDVTNEQTGKVTNWEIELGAPFSLTRLGWKRTTLKVDDVVIVEGSLARFKDNLGNARSVTLASTGQKLGAASSEAR